jgi:hypothetical protein
VFFSPGSSLGNFHPEQALQFLQHIADPAQGKARGLLLGIDLVKDTARLEAAYDDALGVTAAFNKNLLLNIADYMTDDSGLIALRTKEIKVRLLNRARIRNEKLYWQLVNTVGPLALVLICAIFQHYIRKRKYAR